MLVPTRYGIVVLLSAIKLSGHIMTSHFGIKHPDLVCDVDITPADISVMKKKK